MPAKPIPDGYHTATPYLIVHDGAAAIEFYKRAFRATELFRLNGPGGKIAHAEIQIGNSRLMLADEVPQMKYKSPRSLGGSPVGIMLYVVDVDARFRQALAAGAKEIRPVTDQFYGDRSGTLEDPFGLHWTIATHMEDLTQEEVERRMNASKPKP